MSRRILMFLAGAAAWAQGPSGWVASPGTSAVIGHMAIQGQTGPVTGKPVQATEVRHSVQTLSDGTKLESSSSSHFYRDSQGRMRTESAERVEIYDPVAGFIYDLNSQRKTYTKTPTNADRVMIAVAGGSSRVNQTSGTTRGDRPSHVDLGIPYRSEGQVNTVTEDMPPQTINGIAARGARITSTVPTGAVGNDRDFKIVNERWYSDELQILLKTVNSDPRFGVNTYELTNIVQAPPDPALFQIPPGYTARGER
ncbi:MAG TPA: hypothetical protein VME43_11755 [Bryobacteraceae bacterium]|nr:hypothetical protein [Bryobacteraceae bacterium]